MKIRNSVQLIGNLGADPEIRETKGGRKMAKLSIATNETYRDGSGKKVTDTQWHNAVAFGKTAEIIEKYLSKGKEVALEGKLTHNAYEDKDGQKRYFTQVVINDLLLLGKAAAA